MKTLKNKSIYMTDKKTNKKEIYYEYKDVKEAVLKFEDELNPLIHINKYAYLSIKHNYKKHFGDWED